LEERIGGAAIPVIAQLLLRRNHFDELAEGAAQESPAALNVLDERMRFVLRHHRDAPDAGVDAIGKYEVDNAKLAAEVRRRFATMIGQGFKTFTPPAGHDDGQGAMRKAADVASSGRGFRRCRPKSGSR
jgi:hypothetical protein